ncbi:MAG: DNA repair protein RecN, partial [Proteobacteria bacterium]|nr:DNA repair protein RecN [Pseudomonadota bacterium]
LDALNAARAAAAEDLCARLGREMAGLGFSEHARVEFVFEPVEVYSGPGGVLWEQRGRLLWVPNPGQPPRPLDKIASGGELSRFLLALTSLQAEAAQPTLIFDEVDAGIGGHTLIRVGERLTGLAARQQMILITHWPQLARLAQRHFLVRKDVLDGLTYTGCARLDAPAIEAELLRMSGGGPG